MTKAIAMIIATLLVQGHAAAIPTAILHGLGDACDKPGMKHFTKAIAKGTGGYAACIESAPSTETSLLVGMEKQVAFAFAQLKDNGNFNGEFNLVGLSQGALLARVMVERFDMPGKVRRLISIAGPQAGIAEEPDCFKGRFCGTIQWDPKSLKYFRLEQHFPAGNYLVLNHKLNEYMAGSLLLADVNNEKIEDPELAAVYKKRISALDGVMFVGFNKDSVISKGTAWFQRVDTSTNQVLTMYNHDCIGLGALDKAGKVARVEIDGDHLQFSQSDIEDIFVPFLMSRKLSQQESGVQAKAVMV